MRVIKTPQDMTASSREHLRRGLSIGFVPTMGALHKGHLSLVEKSKEENDITVVSIFVNPVQFGPGEDYGRYPRDIGEDTKKLYALDVDIVFIPEERTIYPDNYYTFVTVEKLTETLCGSFRPGHFKGVATVVTKLFNIVRPTRSYFGQKDYQQSLVIRTLVKDLNMGIDIAVCPTVREDDGLAMSSRNAYLSTEERGAAAIIYKALKEISEKLVGKKLPLKKTPEEFGRILSSGRHVDEIQYASAYDPLTLDEIREDDYTGGVLLAAALKIGRTRLIDNMLVEI